NSYFNSSNYSSSSKNKMEATRSSSAKATTTATMWDNPTLSGKPNHNCNRSNLLLRQCNQADPLTGLRPLRSRSHPQCHSNRPSMPRPLQLHYQADSIP